MRVIKIKSLLIIAGVLGFFACNEVEEKATVRKSQKNSNSVELSENRFFTDQQISEISELHNTYLDVYFSEADVTSTTLSELHTIMGPNYLPFEEEHNLNLSFPSNFDIEESVASYIINKDDFNDLLFQVQSLMLNLNVDDENCYEDLVNNLNDLKINYTNNLDGLDLDCAYSMIEVLKKSSHYWLPVQAGGSGEGYSKLEDYIDFYFDPDFEPSIPFGEVIGRTALADGVSMMWFCLVVGVSGAINPALVPAGILGYFGARVGGASIVAFFNNLALLD